MMKKSRSPSEYREDIGGEFLLCHLRIRSCSRKWLCNRSCSSWESCGSRSSSAGPVHGCHPNAQSCADPIIELAIRPQLSEGAQRAQRRESTKERGVAERAGGTKRLDGESEPVEESDGDWRKRGRMTNGREDADGGLAFPPARTARRAWRRAAPSTRESAKP